MAHSGKKQAERATEAVPPGLRARRRQRMEHPVDALMGEFKI
jgi:hypothetical protein